MIWVFPLLFVCLRVAPYLIQIIKLLTNVDRDRQYRKYTTLVALLNAEIAKRSVVYQARASRTLRMHCDEDAALRTRYVIKFGLSHKNSIGEQRY